MTIWDFIILVCLWVAISIIIWHIVKIRSLLLNIRTSQCENQKVEIRERTNYMPFFEIADYDKLKEIMKECFTKENNIEFELNTIIDSREDVEVIVNKILDRYNITPKQKEN